MKMAGELDEAAKQILGTLLADFAERKLSASDLHSSYVGPKIDALATAVCNVEDINEVDFEVAFKELENKKLISTGPLKAHDNDQNSAFVFIGLYSEREYAFLTEEGYKAARKAPNRPQQRVQRVINTVNIHGGNFNNTQLAAGEAVQQSMAITGGADSDIVARLITILEEQGKPITAEQKTGIQAAITAANDGDGKEAKSLLARACGSVWESVQPVMWPIVGELVKKSLGL